jgi:hypothetical protein
MNIVFYASDKPRERILADAFRDGAVQHGDTVTIRPLTVPVEVDPSADVACMVGVKSRELFQAHWDKGVHIVYLDKGYSRHKQDGPLGIWEYWRVAVDAHQPTRFLARMKKDSSRWDKLGLEIAPTREEGEHILLAGSSGKYHAFYGLIKPTEYALKVVKRIRKNTDMPIIYRPKPSWRDAVPIDDTEYSPASEPIARPLKRAHVLVTHGSNACFEALLAGVPTIVLGDGVTKPISSIDLADIREPKIASDEERHQLACNLAWFQWTRSEMASGEMWSAIRSCIYG